MRFIGDVHGKWNSYKSIASGAEKSIQIGDFGFGFGQSESEVASMQEFMKSGNHRFIRGNHDNPAMCKEMAGYIPDCHVEDDMMFLGGAYSPDQHMRTENVSWWRDEELSYQEMTSAVELYKKTEPRVMITHDAPESVVRVLFPFYKRDSFSITRQGLNAMFEIHQPELWIFGHWHKNVDKYWGATRFICLNELSYINI